jgi:O-antigen ligase
VFTAPLFTVARLTLTGDRLLGLLALGVLIGLSVMRRLRWTPIHSALALFVGVQVLTTLANAEPWPQGLKFVTIYVLGFACFCLAAESARSPEGRHGFVTAWIAVGAGLGVIATVLAVWANLSQTLVWGTGIVQALSVDPEHPRLVFAGRVTFQEPNLLSSFLLIPFALGLWLWRPRTDAASSPRCLVASLAALVFGLTFGFTRAAWCSMAGIAALWWWSERPPWRRVAALGAMLLLAFLLQTAVVGASPFGFRILQPTKTGYDRNLLGRFEISKVTVDSWLTRPLVGHGAGSINRLSIVRPSGKRIERIWNGNLILFVLHDSGLVGLAALLWLSVVVWRRGARVIRRGMDVAQTSSLTIPLLAIGGGLCFAYQFTHGLWLMYPYVYLGLLAAATDEASQVPRVLHSPHSPN